MSKKTKVMTIVGTRPEIIRLSRVMYKLDKYCDHVLVHTGQNYDFELNEIFFQDLEIRRPDFFLNAAGATAAETIGNIISAADKIMAEVKPDALLILGDTNSCLSAIAGKRKKIPIFHMEAGNRCFDFRVPEEINRRIVDHIADINLTYSHIAREYLLREGLPPDQIIVTGSPMREVIENSLVKIKASDILGKLQLRAEKYFVVSSHREENVDTEQNLLRLLKILDRIAKEYDQPVIVTTHPRTRQSIEAVGIKSDNRVVFHKPFGFLDYIQLQMNAHAVLSDSGTITEESSILNFPALNLREAHERPEGMEEGAVMLVGLDPDKVLEGIEILHHQGKREERTLRRVVDYSADNVSEKVVRLIISYTDYINRKVWRKN